MCAANSTRSINYGKVLFISETWRKLAGALSVIFPGSPATAFRMRKPTKHLYESAYPAQIADSTESTFRYILCITCHILCGLQEYKACILLGTSFTPGKVHKPFRQFYSFTYPLNLARLSQRFDTYIPWAHSHDLRFAQIQKWLTCEDTQYVNHQFYLPLEFLNHPSYFATYARASSIYYSRHILHTR